MTLNSALLSPSQIPPIQTQATLTVMAERGPLIMVKRFAITLTPPETAPAVAAHTCISASFAKAKITHPLLVPINRAKQKLTTFPNLPKIGKKTRD
jgi:hypothetical protein